MEMQYKFIITIIIIIIIIVQQWFWNIREGIQKKPELFFKSYFIIRSQKKNLNLNWDSNLKPSDF